VVAQLEGVLEAVGADFPALREPRLERAVLRVLDDEGVEDIAEYECGDVRGADVQVELRGDVLVDRDGHRAAVDGLGARRLLGRAGATGEGDARGGGDREPAGRARAPGALN